MRIRYGFDIEIDVSQPTTILTAFDVEARRRGDIVWERPLLTDRVARIELYTDIFGNRCRRIQATPGTVRLAMEGVIEASQKPDPTTANAEAVPVSHLPIETLPFLLGSRYCETDHLTEFAWNQFGRIKGGWARVQAICDYVHNRLSFGYEHARPTRTAVEAYNERVGVCRDFTHLAVALCRCVNIPARYCNGYLGDIGVVPDPAPMDFNAWFEAYIGNSWYTFDARHNIPRVGRILVACGRDAMDIPILQTFGPHSLRSFQVITEEIPQDGSYAEAAE
jgi:transglutaminase-like putative cysteine protease